MQACDVLWYCMVQLETRVMLQRCVLVVVVHLMERNHADVVALPCMRVVMTGS